jgi:tetratricopeptide (TPR) repeat protein
MQAHQDQELMRSPGYATLQVYFVTPYFVMARFGQWDELLAEPRPAEDLIFANGIWHYAHGLAAQRQGDEHEARQSLAALSNIAEDPEMEANRIWETNTMAAILDIGRQVLAGEIALASGEMDAAIAHFEKAVQAEDGLIYTEPPDWYVPARHHLGSALLAANRAADAERVYRLDLAIYPDNGWSLRGLEQSLHAQGKTKEAGTVKEHFERVWAKADVAIQSSRL